MGSYRLKDMTVTLETEGSGGLPRLGALAPAVTGTEIRTADHAFLFNLNGQIRSVRGLGVDWPHPYERLKRTDGNDWVYYAVGTGSAGPGLFESLGQYYLPCPTYPSNSPWRCDPFSRPGVMGAFAAWSRLYATICQMPRTAMAPAVAEVLDGIANNDESALHARARKRQAIIGAPVPVLPPETRLVDYDVIPLIIADGCLYHCAFCCFQPRPGFTARTRADIVRQINELAAFYDRDLTNRNAVFLGNQDALAAGGELVVMAAAEAYRAFGFARAGRQRPGLFLFASVDSLLRSADHWFDELGRLPYDIHINIGLESVDPATLAGLGKPVEAAKVKEAFGKMLALNQAFANIDICANFVLGDRLGPDHTASLAELLAAVPAASAGKGAVYLSPLMGSQKPEDLFQSFKAVKNRSRLPVFLYLIQRL